MPFPYYRQPYTFLEFCLTCFLPGRMLLFDSTKKDNCNNQHYYPNMLYMDLFIYIFICRPMPVMINKPIPVVRLHHKYLKIRQALPRLLTIAFLITPRVRERRNSFHSVTESNASASKEPHHTYVHPVKANSPLSGRTRSIAAGSYMRPRHYN